ncbi:Semaphorin-4D [Camelus dromedarius]|uniref:Semaphorin-4D n=1 Tax=Camelus dromedarius TaxID=9838 RepID=A0A5N4C0R6_CAMDR|nr:Semaphorin-4D [Camelus dromedarius]
MFPVLRVQVLRARATHQLRAVLQVMATGLWTATTLTPIARRCHPWAFAAKIPAAAPADEEVQLVQFHKLGIFNYSASLLSEDKDTLYMGTWEAMFASNAHISKKEHERTAYNVKGATSKQNRTLQVDVISYLMMGVIKHFSNRGAASFHHLLMAESETE